MPEDRAYNAPSSGEKLFNRVFGFLAGVGIAPSFIYLLEVRGRKSGKTYSTAVNLMELDGKQFLVAPRGRTQVPPAVTERLRKTAGAESLFDRLQERRTEVLSRCSGRTSWGVRKDCRGISGVRAESGVIGSMA
jgi:hypothetical protein